MQQNSTPTLIPIKNALDLRKWDQYIEANCSRKIHTYFLLGLDLGLLPTFLLTLKWDDIKLEKKGNLIGKVEPYILMPSKIQDEPRKFYFNDRTLAALDKLRSENPDDVYIFQNSYRNSKKDKPAPMTSRYISSCLSDAAKKSQITLPGDVGAVTLRKCFGYHHLVHGDWSLHEMMRYFEQRSLSFTKHYLDITDEKIMIRRPEK